MTQTDFDFTRLISPVEPAAFFREFWEKAPLIVPRNDPDYYSGLFSRRAMSEMMYFTRPRFAGFRSHTTPTNALRGVAPEEEHHFVGRDDELAELSREFAEGKSFLIHGLDKRWGSVGTLCRTLEGTLHYPVNAAMFLTPAQSQGFDAHSDGIDGFILQIEGSKNWRIYRPSTELPLTVGETPCSRKDLGDPILEVKLRAGDLLYLPRGYIHEAFASECTSLHVTVAVAVLRWTDLLASALTCVAAKDVRFRQAMPIGLLAKGGDAAVAEKMRELLQILAGHASAAEALDHLADQFIGNLPALPGGQFVPPEHIELIDLDTVLEKSPGVICRVIAEEEAVAIQFPGNRIRGPQAIAPALRFIARESRFAVRALPDPLSDNAKLVLVRRLVRDGLLVIAPRS